VGCRPVLPLLGIRLGLDGVNPIYYETIKVRILTSLLALYLPVPSSPLPSFSRYPFPFSLARSRTPVTDTIPSSCILSLSPSASRSGVLRHHTTSSAYRTTACFALTLITPAPQSRFVRSPPSQRLQYRGRPLPHHTGTTRTP
jgi:hypothetical protein